ncbi:hypothetical protein ACLB2K_059885 [Fragaria x ananassa]
MLPVKLNLVPWFLGRCDKVGHLCTRLKGDMSDMSLGPFKLTFQETMSDEALNWFLRLLARSIDSYDQFTEKSIN